MPPRRKRIDVPLQAVVDSIACWTHGRAVLSIGDLERFLESWTPKMRAEMGCTMEMVDRAFIDADKDNKGTLTAEALHAVINSGSEFAGIWRHFTRMAIGDEALENPTPSAQPAKAPSPPTKPKGRPRKRLSAEREPSHTHEVCDTPSWVPCLPGGERDWVYEEHANWTPQTTITVSPSEPGEGLPRLPPARGSIGSDTSDMGITYHFGNAVNNIINPSPPEGYIGARKGRRGVPQTSHVGAAYRPLPQPKIKVIKVVGNLHPKPFIAHFCPEGNHDSKLRAFRDEHNGFEKYDDNPLPSFSRRGFHHPALPIFKADFNMRKKLPFDQRAETLRVDKREDNVLMSATTHVLTPRDVDKKLMATGAHLFQDVWIG